jgi:hypothetical protein
MMSEEKILTQKIAEQVLEDLEDQDWVDLNEFTSIEDAAAKILGKWESGRVVVAANDSLGAFRAPSRRTHAGPLRTGPQSR